MRLPQPISTPQTVALLGALLVLALVANLGVPPFYNEEPRRALVALEMLLSGQWWVPQLAGELYFKKPPVFNWLLAPGLGLFPDHPEAAVRWVSAAAQLLTAWMVYRFGRQRFGEQAALMMAFFLATMPHLLLYGTLLGEIDVFYMAVTAASYFLFYDRMEKGYRVQGFVALYGLAAVGFLTKSLPSVPFAGLSVVAYYLVRGPFWRIVSWQHLLGGLVFVVVVGAYFWVYDSQADLLEYLHVQFAESGNRVSDENTLWGRLYHLVVFPADTWLRLLPCALGVVPWLLRDSRRWLWAQPALRWALLAFLLNFTLYVLAPGSRPRYIFPLYPLAAVFLAAGLHRWPTRWRPKLKPALVYLVAVLVVALPAGALAWALVMGQAFSWWLWLVPLVGVSVVWLRPGWARAVVLLLVVRLVFDGLVLPIRAADTEAAVVKQQAQSLAAKTPAEQVYMLPTAAEPVPQFAFYFCHSRQQLLERRPPMEGMLFLLHASQVKPWHQVVWSSQATRKVPSYTLVRWRE